MELIRRGAAGDAVRDVQQRLAAIGVRIDPEESSGQFGSSTEDAVRAFQRSRRLPADGIIGPDTWGQLVESGYTLGDRGLYLHEPYFRGDDVRTLQRKLNALGFDAWREDGIFGQHVDRAVRSFQKNVGLPSDGIVGAVTVDELDRMRPDLDLPSRAQVREAAGVDRHPDGLQGAVIAIDPGHGPADPGAVGPSGLVEHEATFLLAQSLADVLRKRGALPTLLREQTTDASTSERAAMANEVEAVACIAIHMNDGDPGAEGATCLFYGSDVSRSPAGERLAEAIMAEVVGQLGRRDCRTHPMALAILRETRMPAVQFEPCFITNPDEEADLQNAAFRARLAAAVADGLARFLEN